MVDAVLALPEDTRLMILAPVAREKKGEFVELFAEMQAQGYVRFRVDGADLRIRRPAQAQEDREARHRRGDRPREGARRHASSAWPRASRPRCAWPTAGAPSRWRWTRGKEHLFNAKFACPICHYSLAELEPRLFSFNSPVGACPTCDGLGHMRVLRSRRAWWPFPSLSLASGAIKGWDRRNGYYFSMLESVAKHYKFDVDAPFEDLPAAVQQVVLHGSGEEEIEFSYVDGERATSPGKKLIKKHPFEGIIPNMAAALPRDRFGRGARGAGALPQHAALPRLRRHAAAPRGALRDASAKATQAARDLRDQPRHAAREPAPTSRRCSCAAPRPRSPTRWCARSACA